MYILLLHIYIVHTDAQIAIKHLHYHELEKRRFHEIWLKLSDIEIADDMHLKPQESSLHRWPGHSWQDRRCRPNVGHPTCLHYLVLLFLDPQWFPEKWACITVNMRSLKGYRQRTVKIITNQNNFLKRKTIFQFPIQNENNLRKGSHLKVGEALELKVQCFFFFILRCHSNELQIPYI